MASATLAVLITRAQPGANETAIWLQEDGFEPIVSPCLQLQRDETVTVPDRTSYSDLVLTSANSVRFYVQDTEDRTATAWCVGPATAKAAREAGFRDVRESAGNAKDLAKFILTRSEQPEKPMLHVANAAASGILKSELEAAGYPFVFCPLYKAAVTEKLTDNAISAFEGPNSAIVLVHSFKGAEAFSTLAGGLDVSGQVGVAISTAAARPLIQMGFRSVVVASEPNEMGLRTALRRAANNALSEPSKT